MYRGLGSKTLPVWEGASRRSGFGIVLVSVVLCCAGKDLKK